MWKSLVVVVLVLCASLALSEEPGSRLGPDSLVRVTRGLAIEGDVKAQYNLGVMYSKGIGIPQDYTEALKWYRRAAAQGYAEAQAALGSMYYTGQGVPQDYVEALK